MEGSKLVPSLVMNFLILNLFFECYSHLKSLKSSLMSL